MGKLIWTLSVIIIVTLVTLVTLVIVGSILASRRAGYASRPSFFQRVRYAILRPPFLKPKIRTTIAYPIASYDGQPLSVIRAALEQGRVTTLEIHDSALANPARAPILQVFAHLRNVENGENGMFLNAPTIDAMRQGADDLLRAVQHHNATHEMQVRIQMTSW